MGGVSKAFSRCRPNVNENQASRIANKKRLENMPYNTTYTITVLGGYSYVGKANEKCQLQKEG